MPKATVSHDHQRFELETLPGGFVLLRQLSYYEMMHRRDIAAKLYTEQKVETGKSRRERRAKGANQPTEEMIRSQLEIMNVAIMEFEFSNCIVDHNLEDDNGAKLDFNNPMTFRVLHPKVGAEIGRYIDELNQEDEDDVGPLPNAPSSSSKDGETQPDESTLVT